MVPISQAWTVASYVITQKLKGRKRYPLVLMLEPLFRCNLACAGCGKIQYPDHILDKRLTPQQCFDAVEECGAPMVSIPGGEPLIHHEIDQIVAGLVERKKYIYLCTNALLFKRKLDLFKPSKYLTFSVHMDGLKEEHDTAVCRDGTYDIAVEAIKEAVKRGFRVTTNTTLFSGANPAHVREFFDKMMDLGVEGMMLSPGYTYEKAPDQENFLHRDQTKALFKQILQNPKKSWKFNLSPLFLKFLQGDLDFECTPWGSPAYNVFGWQKPCYLLAGRLREDLQGISRADRLGQLRQQERQPEVPGLHGPLRLRALRRRCHLRLVGRLPPDGQGDDGGLGLRRSLQSSRSPMPADIKTQPDPHRHASLEGAVFTFQSEADRVEAIDKAFDYRGDVTLTLRNEHDRRLHLQSRRQGRRRPASRSSSRAATSPASFPTPTSRPSPSPARTPPTASRGTPGSARRNPSARPKPTASRPKPKPRGICNSEIATAVVAAAVRSGGSRKRLNKNPSS